MNALLETLLDGIGRGDGHAAALRDPAVALDGPGLRGAVAGLAAQIAERSCPGDLVALLLDRSAAHAVAVLACLWAGRAFMTAQRADPPGLQWAAARDAGARLILTARHDVVVSAAGVPSLAVDVTARGSGSPSPTSASQLAYCIQTSGSTGGPKTIAVPRAALAHYLDRMIGYLDARLLDGAILQLNPAFDAALTPLLVPLVTGRTLEVIAPGEEVVGLAAALASRTGRWLVDVTPSQVAPLVDELAGLFPAVLGGHLLIGGEPLSPADAMAAQRALPAMEIHNIYGPAETTIGSTIGAVAAPFGADVPVGRALGNTTVEIVGPDGASLAIGITGEIAIGGAGVALGYRGAPRQTAVRFVPDPRSEPGTRRYLTGDCGWLDPDGALHCDGRFDDQVKVRGHRVELGGVEARIAALSGVADAAVVVDDRHGELVAFVRGEGSGALADLRAALAVTEPAWRVPTFWSRVDRLPLTANGKLDRAALLASWRASQAERTDVGETAAGEAGAADADPLAAMTEIWRDLLGHARFGPDDPFFAVGGHSLLAVRLRAAIRRHLDRIVPLALLVEASTARKMAAMVACSAAPVPTAVAASSGDGGDWFPLSPFQEPLWFSSRRTAAAGEIDPYVLASAVRITGPLDPAGLRRAVAQVLDRHGAFATRFEGGGTVRQRVGDAASVDWAWETFPTETEARRRLDTFAAERLEPTSPALLRVGLFGYGPEGHFLAFQAHHLVTDEWTMNILVDEVSLACAARALPPALPRDTFARIGRRQRAAFEAGDWEHHLHDWERALADLPPPTPLLRRTETGARGAARVSIRIDPAVSAALGDAARHADGTMNAAALAVFAAACRRHAGLDQLLVTAPVTVRDGEDETRVAGYFLNNVVLRVPIRDPSALLAEAITVTKRALTHRLAPLAEVRSRCRELAEPHRFHARFVFVGAGSRLVLPGCKVEEMTLPPRAAKFDLQVTVQQMDDGLVFHLDFDTGIHSREEVIALGDAIRHAAAAAASTPTGLPADPRAALRARLGAQLRNGAVAAPSSEKSWSIEPWTEVEGVGLAVAPVAGASLADALASRRQEVREALLRHGALLFRGWEVAGGPDGFEAVVAAIGDALLDYENQSTPRTRVAGRVFTSTEYPADQAIPLHNENSYSHRWPDLLGFYCRRAASHGGATPICDSRGVLGAISAATRDEFERRQVRYTRHFGRAGLSWQVTFQTTDPARVAAYCHRHGIGASWDGAGELTTAQVLPAVRRHPATGEAVWFNQAHLFHVSSLGPALAADMVELFGIDRLPRHATFGDGGEIPDEALAEIRAAYGRYARPVVWEGGDVLLLDNMLFAHGREPFGGPREVFVGMAGLYG